MSRQRTPPIFLERRSYRQRRMLDALRLLPILGALLWMVPVVWPVDASQPQDDMALSTAVVYVFGVWVVLILCSAGLWRVLKPSLQDGHKGASEPPSGSEAE